MDAQCFGGIILQKSADESYCIAKNPDPEKLEILTCYGEGIVDCQPNTKLVHMTLGNTSVLCTSLVGAHCIDQNPGRPETDISPIFVDVID